MNNLLQALAVPSLFAFLQSASAVAKPPNVVATNQSMVEVQHALETYHQRCGDYPTTENGLDALTQPIACAGGAPVLVKIPRDGWGHFLEYVSNGKTYTVRSFGRDGKEGGTGEDADLVTSSPR